MLQQWAANLSVMATHRQLPLPLPRIYGTAGTLTTTGQGDAMLQQWAANLSVMATHRQLPGALDAIAALGNRLQAEGGKVWTSVENGHLIACGRNESGLLLGAMR